jgi:hypothetical protein
MNNQIRRVQPSLQPSLGPLLFAAALLIWAGCGILFGGSSGDDTTDVGDVGPPVPGVTCRVLGQVSDQAGAALTQVRVSSGAVETMSDDIGRFELAVAASGTSALLFEKAGFAPSYRSVTPAGAQLATTGAVMVAVDVVQTIDPAVATHPVHGRAQA